MATCSIKANYLKLIVVLAVSVKIFSCLAQEVSNLNSIEINCEFGLFEFEPELIKLSNYLSTYLSFQTTNLQNLEENKSQKNQLPVIPVLVIPELVLEKIFNKQFNKTRGKFVLSSVLLNKFKALLNKLHQISSKKNYIKNYNKLTDKLRKYSFQIRVDCIILAEFFEVEQLYDACAICLSEIISDKRYMAESRAKSEFFKRIFGCIPDGILRRKVREQLAYINRESLGHILAQTMLRDKIYDSKTLREVTDLTPETDLVLTSGVNIANDLELLNLADPVSHKIKMEFDAPIVAVTKCDSYIAIATKLNKIFLLDLNFKILKTLDCPGEIKYLKFAFGNMLLVLGLKSLDIYDLNLDARIASYNYRHTVYPFVDTFDGYFNNSEVQFILTIGQKGLIRLRLANNGDLLPDIVNHGKPVVCACLSPDKKYLVTITNDKCIWLWEINKNLKTGTTAFKLKHKKCMFDQLEYITKIIFSPQEDDNYFIAINSRGNASFWSTQDLTYITTIGSIRDLCLTEQDCFATTCLGSLEKIKTHIEVSQQLLDGDYIEQIYFILQFMDLKNINNLRKPYKDSGEKKHIQDVFDTLPEEYKECLKQKFGIMRKFAD